MRAFAHRQCFNGHERQRTLVSLVGRISSDYVDPAKDTGRIGASLLVHSRPNVRFCTPTTRLALMLARREKIVGGKGSRTYAIVVTLCAILLLRD